MTADPSPDAETMLRYGRSPRPGEMYDASKRRPVDIIGGAGADTIFAGGFTNLNIFTGQDDGSHSRGEGREGVEHVAAAHGERLRIVGSDNQHIMNIRSFHRVDIEDGAGADVINVSSVQYGVRIVHGGGDSVVTVDAAQSLVVREKSSNFGWTMPPPATCEYNISRVEWLDMEGSAGTDIYRLNTNVQSSQHVRTPRPMSGRIDGRDGVDLVFIDRPSTDFRIRTEYGIDGSITKFVVMDLRYGGNIELTNIEAISFTDQTRQLDPRAQIPTYPPQPSVPVAEAVDYNALGTLEALISGAPLAGVIPAKQR